MKSGKKGRLLFLSHRTPYPVFNGQSTRTFNILRLLSRDFDVVALCFDNVDPSRPKMQMQERRAVLEKYVSHLEVVDIPQNHSSARLLLDHMRSTLTGAAYTQPMYDAPAFRQALDKVLGAGNIDLVHIDSIDLGAYINVVSPLPVICNHHNVESELLARRADNESNPLLRWYIGHQAELVKKMECEFLPPLALNVAVSDDDARTMQKIAPGSRFVTIPNGVDTEKFDAALFNVARNSCVFVGGTNWYPNRDALDWYSAEIAPLLHGVETNWTGYCTAAEREQFHQKNGIRMNGFADDVRAVLASARCFIAPLRVGGGTRLKILEAWSMGAPVVSTTVGCEGLDTEHGRNILIADSAAGFAEAMTQLLTDNELAARIGAAGRRTAEETYSWDVLARKLSKHYVGLLRDGQPESE